MKNAGYAFRNLAVPARPDQQIKARRGAVHFAELNEAVGTKIDHLVDPEAIAEVRHLNHDWRNVERKRTDAVDDVLVRASNRALLGIDVVGEHDKTIGRRLHQRSLPNRLLHLHEMKAAIVHVHHRPRPEIGVLPDMPRIVLRDLHARVGTGRHGASPVRRRRQGLRIERRRLGASDRRRSASEYRSDRKRGSREQDISAVRICIGRHGVLPELTGLVHCAATFSTSGSFQTLSKNSFFGP